MIKYTLIVLLGLSSQSYAQTAGGAGTSTYTPNHADNPDNIQDELDQYLLSYRQTKDAFDNAKKTLTTDQSAVDKLQAQIQEAKADIKSLKQANRHSDGPKDKTTLEAAQARLADLQTQLETAQGTVQTDQQDVSDKKDTLDQANDRSAKTIQGFKNRFNKVVADNKMDQKLNSSVQPLAGKSFNQLSSTLGKTDNSILTQPPQANPQSNVQKPLLTKQSNALDSHPNIAPDKIDPKTMPILKINIDPKALDTCKDQAAAALVKDLLSEGTDKNSAILSQLVHRAALKFNQQTNPSSKNAATLEDFQNTNSAGSDTKPFVKKITDLYQAWGISQDKAMLDAINLDANKKYQYFKNQGTNKKYQLRLNNENASSILFGLSLQADPKDPNAITAEDAASVWAMEKLRADNEASDLASGKKTSAYSVGQSQGNLLSFSTLVYQYNDKSLLKDKAAQATSDDPLDPTKKVNESDYATHSVMKAAKTLSSAQLKCLTGNPDCEISNVLQSDQDKIIKAVQAKLNESVMKGTLSGAVDGNNALQNYRVTPSYTADGTVNLSLTPIAATTQQAGAASSTQNPPQRQPAGTQDNTQAPQFPQIPAPFKKY